MDNAQVIKQSNSNVFSMEINVPAFTNNSKYTYVDANEYASGIIVPYSYYTMIDNINGTKYYGIKTNNYSYWSKTEEGYKVTTNMDTNIMGKVVELEPVTTESKLFWFNIGEQLFKINSNYAGKELFFTYKYSYEYTQEGITPELMGNVNEYSYNVTFYGALPVKKINKVTLPVDSIYVLFKLLNSDYKNDFINNIRNIYTSYSFTVPYTYTYDPDGTAIHSLTNLGKYNYLPNNIYTKHKESQQLTWEAIYIEYVQNIDNFLNDNTIQYFKKHNSIYTIVNKQFIVNYFNTLANKLNVSVENINVSDINETSNYYKLEDTTLKWVNCTKENISSIISSNLPIYTSTYENIQDLSTPISTEQLLLLSKELIQNTDLIVYTDNITTFGVYVAENNSIKFTKQTNIYPNNPNYYYYDSTYNPISSILIEDPDPIDGEYLNDYYTIDFENTGFKDSNIIFENYYEEIDVNTINKINKNVVDIYERHVTYSSINSIYTSLDLLQTVTEHYENGLAFYDNTTIDNGIIHATNLGESNARYYKLNADKLTYSPYTYNEVKNLRTLPNNIYVRHYVYDKLSDVNLVETIYNTLDEENKNNIVDTPKYVKLYNYYKWDDLTTIGDNHVFYVERQDENSTKYDYIPITSGISKLGDVNYYAKTFVELTDDDIDNYTGDIYVHSNKYLLIESEDYFNECLALGKSIYTVEGSRIFIIENNGQSIDKSGNTVYYQNNLNADNNEKISIVSSNQLNDDFGKSEVKYDGIIKYIPVGYKCTDVSILNWDNHDSIQFYTAEGPGYVRVQRHHVVKGFNVKFYKHTIDKIDALVAEQKLETLESVYVKNENINLTYPDILYPINNNGFIISNYDLSKDPLIIDGFTIANNYEPLHYYTRKEFTVPSHDIHMHPNKEYYGSADTIRLTGKTNVLPLSYVSESFTSNNVTWADSTAENPYVKIITSYTELTEDINLYNSLKYVYTKETDIKEQITYDYATILVLASCIPVYYKINKDDEEFLNCNINNISTLQWNYCFYIDKYVEHPYDYVFENASNTVKLYSAFEEYVSINEICKKLEITFDTFNSRYRTNTNWQPNIYTKDTNNELTINYDKYLSYKGNYEYDWHNADFYSYTVSKYKLVGPYPSVTALYNTNPDISHSFIKTKWFYNSYIVNNGLNKSESTAAVSNSAYYTNAAVFDVIHGSISKLFTLNAQNIIVKHYEFNSEINKAVNITDDNIGFKQSVKSTLASMPTSMYESYWVNIPKQISNSEGTSMTYVTTYFSKSKSIGSIADWYEKIMQYKKAFPNYKTDNIIQYPSLAYSYTWANIYYKSSYIGKIEYNYENGGIFDKSKFIHSDSQIEIEDYITQINASMYGIIRNKNFNGNYEDIYELPDFTDQDSLNSNRKLFSTYGLGRIKLLSDGRFYSKEYGKFTDSSFGANSQSLPENAVFPMIIPEVVELKGIVVNENNEIEPTEFQTAKTLTYNIDKPTPFALTNDVEMEFTGTYTWHKPTIETKIYEDENGNTIISNPMPSSEGYWTKDYKQNIIPLNVCSYIYYPENTSGITASIYMPEEQVVVEKTIINEISYTAITNDIVENVLYVYSEDNKEYIYNESLPITFNEETNTYYGVKYSTWSDTAGIQTNIIPLYYKNSEEYKLAYYYDKNFLTYFVAQYNGNYETLYTDNTGSNIIEITDCYPKVEKAIKLIKRTTLSTMSCVKEITHQKGGEDIKTVSYKSAIALTNEKRPVLTPLPIDNPIIQKDVLVWNDISSQYEIQHINSTQKVSYYSYSFETIPFETLSYNYQNGKWYVHNLYELGSYISYAYNTISSYINYVVSSINSLNINTNSLWNKQLLLDEKTSNNVINSIDTLNTNLNNSISLQKDKISSYINSLNDNISYSLQTATSYLSYTLTANSTEENKTINNISSALNIRLKNINDSNNTLITNVSYTIKDNLQNTNNLLSYSLYNYDEDNVLSLSDILLDLHVSNRIPTFKEFICDVSTKLYVAIDFENNNKSPHTIAKSSIIRANALWQELKNSNIVE